MLKLVFVLVYISLVHTTSITRQGPQIGALDFGNSGSEFTDSSKNILKAYNQENIRLVRDRSVQPTSVTIEWSQFSKCTFSTCSEDYLLVDYYQDGDQSNPVMKVYVAKDELSPPNEFRTIGYRGKLHFGFLYFGGTNQALFYVLHPNSWGPYQHRFKTNAFTRFFKSQASKAASTAAAAAVGEAIGSIAASTAAGAAAGEAIGSIIPGAGTIIGSLVRAGVAELSDEYLGDYLRYIG